MAKICSRYRRCIYEGVVNVDSAGGCVNSGLYQTIRARIGCRGVTQRSVRVFLVLGHGSTHLGLDESPLGPACLLHGH